MKRHLLNSAAAFAAVVALSAPVAAAGAQQESGQQSSQTSGAGAAQSGAQAQIADGWSAQEFLDADVYDLNNEQIGEVEDLILSPDGTIQSLVIEAGGFLDIGDTHFAYPIDKLHAATTDNVVVSFNEDRVDDYSLFHDIDDQSASGRNWRITELINDYARFEDGVGFGRVTDAIFDRGGQLQAVVVQQDVAYGVGGPYAWPPARDRFDPGLDYYTVPYDADEVAQLERFDYSAIEQVSGPILGTQQAENPDETDRSNR